MSVVSVSLNNNNNSVRFRATAGGHQSVGQTAGEALDALLAQENGTIDSSAILIQRFVPDRYFTQAQHDRMKFLLAKRDTRSVSESDELDALIDAELEATISRTAATSL